MVVVTASAEVGTGKSHKGQSGTVGSAANGRNAGGNAHGFHFFLACMNTDKLIDSIIEKSKEIKAELFVIGLPKNMDSSIGERALKCREFAEKVSTVTGLETVLRDERLSTVSAHNVLNATNTRGKKRKVVVDQVAAVMILQDYIDYRKNQL